MAGDGPGGGMPNVARWIPSAAPPRLGPAAIFVMHAQEPHGPKTTTTLTLCTQAPHLVGCHGAFAAAPRRSTAKIAGGGHATGRASKKSGGGALSMLHHTRPHQTSDFVLKMHTKQAHNGACVRYMLGFGGSYRSTMTIRTHHGHFYRPGASYWHLSSRCHGGGSSIRGFQPRGFYHRGSYH